MDFSILHDSSIKIRSKNASVVVDPTQEIAKTNADAVIVLGTNSNINTERVADQRILIDGAGEYEVSGVKIAGFAGKNGSVYSILGDNIEIILGKVSEISGMQDKTFSCQIAILNVDDELKSIVARLEPKIVILYGDKKMDGAIALGKENAEAVSKFSVLKDKLPEEMQVVVLG